MATLLRNVGYAMHLWLIHVTSMSDARNTSMGDTRNIYNWCTVSVKAYLNGVGGMTWLVRESSGKSRGPRSVHHVSFGPLCLPCAGALVGDTVPLSTCRGDGHTNQCFSPSTDSLVLETGRITQVVCEVDLVKSAQCSAWVG